MVGINGSDDSTQRSQMMERTVKLIGLDYHATALVGYHKVAAYVLENTAQKCVTTLLGTVQDMSHH